VPVATDSRFRIEIPSDDPALRTLHWSHSFERGSAMTGWEAVPDGWEYRRFFHVAPSATFRVLP
jgi:hypothetical protein